MTPTPINTIILKCRQHLGYDEGRVETAKTILPGHLIEMIANGNYQPHAGAGLQANSLWAVENDFLGDVRAPVTIDTPYVATDLVRFHRALPDDEIYAWLADNITTVVGSKLASNGDGTLKLAATGMNIVAIALEAVTTVGGAAAAARLIVRTVSAGGYFT